VETKMTTPWAPGVQPLIESEKLQRRIAELAAEITRDYAGKDLVLVGVLKGCFLFMADLCRKIDLPLRCDFLGVSSYGDETRSSGVIRITSDVSRPVLGAEVLLVEDIVDTGLTISYLLENLRARRPRTVKVCTLLDKPARRRVQVSIDYRGFTVPDKFVVGYGLDYQGLYRNLPYIGHIEGRF
jgi:hypoxanthine phosphoribosyltransferase